MEDMGDVQWKGVEKKEGLKQEMGAQSEQVPGNNQTMSI